MYSVFHVIATSVDIRKEYTWGATTPTKITHLNIPILERLLIIKRITNLTSAGKIDIM